MENKVVIFGLGFVGQANAIALIRMGYEVYGIDIAKVGNNYHEDDFNKIKFLKSASELPFKPEDKVPAMVCVNSYNGEIAQHLVPARSALAEANRITDGPVILRTSIVARHLGDLDFDIYMPEFLHERHALKEVQFPDSLVIGFKNEQAKAKGLPKFVKEWQEYAQSLPHGKVFIGTPEEGVYIKYLNNLWNALRIGFVNEFGDAIIRDGLPANHEKVIDFVMGRAFYLRYGKSFGGHCLPKDTEGFYADHPYMKLLNGLVESNKDHAKFETGHNARELFWGEE